MKKKMGLVLIAGLLLSSCAYHESKWGTSDSTITTTDRDRAFRECRLFGDAHSEMNPFMAILLTQECMENKGYSRR